MRKILPLALVLPLFANILPVIAAEQAKAAPKTEIAPLPSVPWHMVNLWWYFPPIKDFHELSIDVEISQDMPSEAYNLYISTVFGSLNNEPFYGGVQTNVNGWSALAPGDHKRLHGGHGFIFSRWSEKPTLSVADARATPGGFVEAADYEGNFVSGRRSHPWKAGKYTYSMRRLDTEMIQGKPHTWVGVFVHEHATGREIFVSALRFTGDTLAHNGSNGAFIEFYGTERLGGNPDIANLPPLAVTYSNFRLNGAPADLNTVSVNFVRVPKDKEPKAGVPFSPNLMRVKASEDGRSITCTLANKIFSDSEEPGRTLWEKPKSK